MPYNTEEINLNSKYNLNCEKQMITGSKKWLILP